MNSLTGKNAIVTGATRGIGYAIARMLVIEGANVVICGRTKTSVENAVENLKSAIATPASNKVKGTTADLSSDEQVAELFRFTDRELGPVNVLVNNAGIGIFRPIGDLPADEWKQTLETNLYGVYYASREAIPRFGTQGGGSIVNISSLAGAHAFAGGAAYNASKFGLNGLSEAMMQDLRSENVRVSYVMPGSTATEFGGGDPEAGAEWKIWPEDVAEVVRTILEMPERTLVSRVEVRPTRTKSKT